MAEVYRATDHRLRREVAIKVLPPQLGYSPDLRVRFGRVAQTAAGLSHPNIVSISDVGERDALVWFVMRWWRVRAFARRWSGKVPSPLA
jgi:eukaryotic-like serine/threonine-protein kinase